MNDEIYYDDDAFASIFGDDEDYATPSMEDELHERGMCERDFL